MKSLAVLPTARLNDLVITELNTETLVYDLERNKAHCLNQTAALVWRHCDGKTSAQEVADLLENHLRVPVDIDVVWLAIKQLRRFHLIENSEGLSAAAHQVTRRQLLFKYAPASLALPVIMSISAPTAAQGASCVPEGGDCTSLPCCNPEFVTCVVDTCAQL